MSARPRIFLSSVFYDPTTEKLAIRERIKNLTGGSSVKRGKRVIWVAEDFDELTRGVSSLSALEQALFCVEGVRECEYFLAILTERFGSEIDLDQVGQVPTSFFELELMAAALFGKPTFIYVDSRFDPSERLAAFLELVRPAFPDMSLEKLPEDEIFRRVERLVKQIEHPLLRRIPLRIPRKRLFVDTLFRLRHRPYRVREEPPPIRFLDGRFDPSIKATRADQVPALLDRARQEQNLRRRLVILWFAVHALMGAPYTDPLYRDFIPLWEDTLGLWNAAAAWSGLHGHAAMAGLAALGSLAAARSIVAAGSDPLHGIPHGPIASAYYSIAKQGERPEIYELALDHLEAALSTAPKNVDGLLAIRGSIRLRLNRVEAAIADYEDVARSRQHLGDGTYGEALSELGYALVLAGRTREGIDNMERGVDLLLKYPRQGFDIRAIRKLAVGLARAGNFSRALDYAITAYDMAEQSGALDQISRIERLAKKLEWLRRRH